MTEGLATVRSALAAHCLIAALCLKCDHVLICERFPPPTMGDAYLACGVPAAHAVGLMF